jgi:hypothetical protein
VTTRCAGDAPAEAAARARGAATSKGNQPLLRLAGIRKNFGPVRALFGINLDIPAGDPMQRGRAQRTGTSPPG